MTDDDTLRTRIQDIAIEHQIDHEIPSGRKGGWVCTCGREFPVDENFQSWPEHLIDLVIEAPDRKATSLRTRIAAIVYRILLETARYEWASPNQDGTIQVDGTVDPEEIAAAVIRHFHVVERTLPLDDEDDDE